MSAIPMTVEEWGAAQATLHRIGALTPINIDPAEISSEWLTQCGAHDFGLEMSCTCSAGGDPRPVISRLLQEIERLRALVALASLPSAAAGAAVEPLSQPPTTAPGDEPVGGESPSSPTGGGGGNA